MHALEGLVCPKCHGPLQTEASGELRCGTDQLRFPTIDGIPSFIIAARKPAPLPGCALSVVIPALNEAESLKQVLPIVEQALTELGVSHEIVVVDGGSTDGTQEVVRAAGARLVSQRLPGFGGAYRAGFEQARGEFIVTQDADGSHDPSFLKDLWVSRHNAEVVIASRYVPGGEADMPAWRSVLSRVLNVTFQRGLSLPIRDLSSGFRLYQRGALAEVTLEGTDFDVLEEILIKALAAGFRVQEVPFRYKARVAGRSHARLFRFAKSYLRTFIAMWRLRNSIASSDYDARAYDSVVPLQRYWQRNRHRIITAQARGFERILDVGCGSSRILASNPNIVGLDVQLHKLRFSRRYGNPLVHGSIFELPFRDGSFDAVICSEVVEHIPAEERPWDELARVLKIGGRLILGTPDYDKVQWRALEWLYGKVSPGGYADEHITHYSRKNLATYLQGKGFTIDRVDYVGTSEMIFTLTKLAPMASPVPVQPVRTALRLDRSRRAA